MKKFLFSACLALVLSVTAFATDNVSFTLLFPDGTWLEKTVSCPENASLWYASYSDSGKMLESGRASAQDGKAVLTLTQAAETVKAFALDDDFKPLSPAALITGVSPYQQGVYSLWDGDFAGAVAAFTDAIQEEDNAPLSYVGRADAYIASGETAKNLAAAKADYEAALALDDTLSEAYLGIADVYIRQEKYEQAIDILLRGANKARETEALTWKLDELDSGTVWDSAGRVRMERAYDENNALIWSHRYSYGEQDLPLSIAAYDANGTLTSYIDLKFDADGNPLIGFSFSYEDGILHRLIFEYDKAGNCVKTTEYNEENRPLQRNFFRYDERGNLIREDAYYWNEDTGKLEANGYLQFLYDEEEELIQREQYSADDDLLAYETWNYNVSGQVKEYCVYSAESGEVELAWRETYEYNGRGDIILTTVYDESGNVSFIDMNQYDDYGRLISVMRYDENGNLTSVMRYDGRGRLMSCEQYDENGSLIESASYDENGDLLP